jgi:hypothetical protein
MTRHIDDPAESRLDAQLRELGAELRALPVPPADERGMRSAFRAKRHRAPRARRAVRLRSRAPFFASAAALIASIATGTFVVLTQPPSRDAERAPLATATFGTQLAATFQPLMYSPGISPSGSYTVVRVRIPLSSLAIGPQRELDGVIEADLLLGEDGLASGIRFDAKNTLLVSTVAR